uniref:Small ribosomal subunit protein eS21 n=1 Tax=Calidris pygmaea TaxID=425635 RepID=A0A8C3JXA7_9CHAR
MQNDAGEFVDLYVPRKCSASNRIIGAKDHASIQINISEVDKVTGRVNGQFKTYAICGAIRRMGESDDSILRLAKNDGIVSKYVCLSYPLTLGGVTSIPKSNLQDENVYPVFMGRLHSWIKIFT